MATERIIQHRNSRTNTDRGWQIKPGFVPNTAAGWEDRMSLNSDLVSPTQVLRTTPGLLAPQTMQKRTYQIALCVVDAMMLALAFSLAYVLRFNYGFALVRDVDPSSVEYTQLAFALIPLWIVLFHAYGLYSFRNLLGGFDEYSKTFSACTAGMMIVIVGSFLAPDNFFVARAWLLMAWGLTFLLVAVGRLLLRRIAYALRSKGFFVTPALIIGINQEARALAENLRDRVYSGYELLGFVDPNMNESDFDRRTSIQGLPIFGSLRTLTSIIDRYSISEVIIASSSLNGEQLVGVSQQLATLPNLQMKLSSGLYEVFTTNMHVETRGSVPLMSINRLRLNPMESTLKMMLDYAVILSALPFLLPVFLIAAILVKLDSPGPIFHRRRVMGIGGKQFDAFKFRSMHVNGDEILEQYPELKAQLKANHKLKWDPRITRIGNFLRRTSLDELPQLINVLRGEMSLVGPRMIAPAETEMYGRMKDNLLTVKPGLTGLWQVSGRSDLSYEERVRLDMLYIRNYSIWLDIQILFFQTLPVVLKGSGAY